MISTLRPIALLTFTLAICGVSRAQVGIPATNTATATAQAEPDEESEGEKRLIHDLRSDLVAERFDTLDRTAETFRREKARWPGGGWKLRTMYQALDAPHQTDPDMAAHLEHLRHWMTQRPQSITARIALAASLKRWAWIARGSGLANTVSENGWKLFHERIAEAQTVLEDSRDLRAMDPQWYSEEMVVGKAQGWDDAREKEMFDRAVQFEPSYQYFYKSRAEYLLPKWYGNANDATDFAKAAADKLRGDLGDYIYWEVATVILKRGNGRLAPFKAQLDWARIQRGFATLQSQYGTNRRQRNELAFMAYEYRDRAVAQQQFASIGQEWSRGVWKDRDNFEKIRDWSTGHQSWP